jgi:hypothetical protein
MTNGIYYIIFKSYLGIIGDGLVVVDNGKVHGGDSRYLYRGTYKVDGTSIKAEIQVSYYRGTLKSVFGPLSKFELILSGNAPDELFTLSGHMPGRSQAALTVEGQKQSDLAHRGSPCQVYRE